MDKKALYKLSYGVFVLSTKSGEKVNACITNTAIQAANSPVRLAICAINTNYTCELIKESGVFALSLLDNTCLYETIAHFGMQSGRNIDKFDGLELPCDVNGVPYITWQTCAVISCKVVDSMDLGSHTLFIGEVCDAVQLNDNAPLTYADYQDRLKPAKSPAAQASGGSAAATGSPISGGGAATGSLASGGGAATGSPASGSSAAPDSAEAGSKITGWRCTICNYIYEGAELPADFMCPICGHGAEDFEPIYG